MNQQIQICHNFILGPICEGPKCDLFARLFFWSNVPPLKVSVKSWFLSLCQEMSKYLTMGIKVFDCVTYFLMSASWCVGKVFQNASTWGKLYPLIVLGFWDKSHYRARTLWLHKGSPARTATIQKAIFPMLGSELVSIRMHISGGLAF